VIAKKWRARHKEHAYFCREYASNVKQKPFFVTGEYFFERGTGACDVNTFDRKDEWFETQQNFGEN